MPLIVADSGERRYQQFDGLRAFAVLAVIYHHWVWNVLSADAYNRWYHYIFKVSLGGLGVKIFFVLSGFLITDILLNNKNCAPGEKPNFIRAFYIRRALRIFPIYFLTLGIAAYLELKPFREDFWWFALYSANILVYLKQDQVGAGTHFWTLAVEEQFYCFWPLLAVFFTRNFEKLAICMVIGSFTTRIFCDVFCPADFGILPVISMDTLAIGGLLALRTHTAQMIEGIVKRLAWLPLVTYPLNVIGIKGLVIGILTHIGDISLAVYLVSGASRNFTGVVGRTLAISSIRYLGAISYGLYLYHPFAGKVAWYILQKFGIDLWSLGLAFEIVLMTIVTVIAAVLSWVIIERPMNSLKIFFPYLPQTATKGEAI